MDTDVTNEINSAKEPESTAEVSEEKKAGSSAPSSESHSRKNSDREEDTSKPTPEFSAKTGEAQQADASYSYEGDTYVYTDPATGFQYRWDTAEKKWVPKQVPAAKEGEAPAGGDAAYEKVGDTYVYRDAETGRSLVWDAEAKAWKPQPATATGAAAAAKKRRSAAGSDQEEEFDSSDESDGERLLERNKETISRNVRVLSDGTRTYTDPADGTVFEWDDVKKAWFPRLDDEFLARYQLSYGQSDQPEEAQATAGDQRAAEEDDEGLEKPKTKKPSEPVWFEVDEAHNNKIYVSGLPADVTEKELVDFVQKCGLIEKDIQTGKMKIKIYRDADGRVKGDALCTYIKIESVDLALNFLDGGRLRDSTVRVERAKFTLKGQYDPTKKPKKRKKRELEKMKKKQEGLFDWRPDQLRGERAKNENVVVLKRLFKPAQFDAEPALLLEYQADLRDECSKFGHVKKVIIYDRNEEGAAQIFFRTPEEADLCIEKLHGRWFAGQKITAETWDGNTKYRKDETEAEKQQRLDKWAQFLQQEEEEKSAQRAEESSEADRSPPQ